MRILDVGCGQGISFRLLAEALEAGIGDLEISTERLTLPHPEVTARRFVLEPLLELDPGLRLPGGRELRSALEGLGAGQRVNRVGPPSIGAIIAGQ